MLSFSDFQYFIEVANTLNLSRASERLGISQPSLSLAIKRLEHAVGTELLIRHQHGVALTQAGKQLLGHVRQLLNYWQETKSLALASKVEVQGSYTLGCHSTLAIDIVSGFLPQLLETYPKLEINLINDVSRRITEQVINFNIDIGIVVNPVKHPDLIISKLCKDEMAFWTTQHKGKYNNIHSGQAILFCDPDVMQTQVLLKKCRDKKLGFGRIITMNSLEVVANITANSSGIGILPSLMTKTLYPKRLKLVDEMPIYNEDICLIYRDEIRTVPAIRKICDSIKKYCR